MSRVPTAHCHDRHEGWVRDPSSRSSTPETVDYIKTQQSETDGVADPELGRLGGRNYNEAGPCRALRSGPLQLDVSIDNGTDVIHSDPPSH